MKTPDMPKVTRIKRAYAISILLLMMSLTMLFALGCRSTPEPFSDENLTEIYSQEHIDNLIANGDNLKALSLIYNSKQLGAYKSYYYNKALDGLIGEWNAAQADGDWRRSLVYLRSFQALGEDSITAGVTEKDLFLLGIDYYLENQKSGAAVSLIQSHMDISQLDEETRSNLAAKLEALGHQAVAAKLRGDANSTSPGLLPKLVRGTVTVWVNRGMKLVGNVGIPDRGIGSGFFVDPQGYLLTNYHVIDSEVDPTYQGYSRLYIKTDDESGERIPARVIGWERNLDLALLKTEIGVPYVFSFSEKNSPVLGSRVNAIGSPGGLTRTLSSGTVSAYARSIQPLTESLQIDVPINPGNSGGPLLNHDGEVIGIVFAGVENYEGVNFAIPGFYVQRMLASLYDGGQVKLPWIGVSAWDTSGRIEITYVVPGSPAADTGLKQGDIITSFDGIGFTDIRALQQYLISHMPATIARLTWEREGESQTGIVTLGVRPEIPLQTALARDAREHLLTPLFGLVVERISGFGLKQNYRITSVLPGSIADESSFSAGDSFSLRRWIHDEEYDVLAIQLVLKGRKAGFLDSAIQLATFLNVNTVF